MKTMTKLTPRRRGRPPANLAGETCARDKLIDTALRLFYRYGINSVGVDRIIAESNVAKMTFFNHFPTKRDLVLEFLKVRDQRFTAWFNTTLEKRFKKTKRKLDAAIEVVELWFKSPDFRGCAFINTTAEVGPDSSEEKLICLGHKKLFTKILEGLAHEDGYKDAQNIADQLALAIDGATIRAQMDGPQAGILALRSLAKVIFSSRG